MLAVLFAVLVLLNSRWFVEGRASSLNPAFASRVTR